MILLVTNVGIWRLETDVQSHGPCMLASRWVRSRPVLFNLDMNPMNGLSWELD